MTAFDITKRFFDMNFYSPEDVKIVVAAKAITVEQFKEITGQEYTA